MEIGDGKLPGMEPSEDNFSDITIEQSIPAIHLINPTNIDSVLEQLKQNTWGCDILLSFFIAALNSYRKIKCLRPFPPFHLNDDGKDFEALKSVCGKIPPLETLLLEPNKCSIEIAQLLSWLFLERNYPVLKRISPDLLPYPDRISATSKPHYVFELCYQEKYEKSWVERRGTTDIILAYHGSTVDNFYSILRVGLQQHLSLDKEVLFGKGIYLSNELSISAHYSPFGLTWNNSAFGNKHSVIAICEIINDIEKVKCRDSSNKCRSINKDGYGEIPEKYFVVTDSDMVRVKYLMVYRKKTSLTRTHFFKYLFIGLIIVYLLGAVFIRVFRNSPVWKSLRLNQILY